MKKYTYDNILLFTLWTHCCFRIIAYYVFIIKYMIDICFEAINVRINVRIKVFVYE